MKLNGQKIAGPNIEVVVIPRQTGDLVFKAQAVLDYDEFHKIAQRPNPPSIMLKGGESSYDYNDKKYLTKIQEWAEQKTHFMVLKSLQATDGLEWETVKMADPTTWENYQNEMKEAGFAPAEINRIVNCVMDACGLNQTKIDEATKRFLAGQAKGQ
jgi:hypothetical protein